MTLGLCKSFWISYDIAFDWKITSEKFLIYFYWCGDAISFSSYTPWWKFSSVKAALISQCDLGLCCRVSGPHSTARQYSYLWDSAWCASLFIWLSDSLIQWSYWVSIIVPPHFSITSVDGKNFLGKKVTINLDFLKSSLKVKSFVRLSQSLQSLLCCLSV